MRSFSVALMSSVALSLCVAGPVAAQDVLVPALTPVPSRPTTQGTVSVLGGQPSSLVTGESLPSLSELFRSVGNDFRRLPSRENALLLAIGASLAGLSRSADRDLTEDWTRVGPEDRLLKPGAIMGNSYVHLGAAFALYATGRASHNTRVGAFGADLVRAQILAQSTTFAIKFAAGRTRPSGETRSFPSGHTSSMFATATVVQQHFGWKAGIPAFAAAAYVGASRIDANKHYLSDVAFGAALGIIAGRTVTLGNRNMKFALTPVGGPGGGVGIGLTRVK
jgi:membrane-associated phospholipid phosphatase